MKIIQKTVIPLYLVVTLAACNSIASPATPNPGEAMETAISAAQTEVVMTQTAMPTATWIMPTATLLSPTMITPTITPPPPTSIPFGAYKDKIDYAMATAPKIYDVLPFPKSPEPSAGKYSGCTNSYDFQHFITYDVPQPMESVKAAFLSYFSTEKWEFTEPISDSIGEFKEPRLTYDVYRIASMDVPAFERLRVIFTDESYRYGKDHIYMQAEFTHIETKENFRYLQGFSCPNGEVWSVLEWP